MTRFEALLDKNNVKIVYFQYHLNCQDIHDKTGDIELGLVERSQNTKYAYTYFKSHQPNVNRRNLKLKRIEIRKIT